MRFFSKNPNIKQKLLHGLASILIIALSFYFFWSTRNFDWRYLIALKYLGFAIICFFGSAIVFLPFPLTIFVALSALYLNPIIVGFLGGFVVSLGSLMSYLVGREGKVIFEDIKGYNKVHNWATKNMRGFWSILFLSLLPLPLFDFIGVTAGVLGLKLNRYFFAVLIGKTISYLFFALSVYYINLNFPQLWDYVKPYLAR